MSSMWLLENEKPFTVYVCSSLDYSFKTATEKNSIKRMLFCSKMWRKI